MPTDFEAVAANQAKAYRDRLALTHALPYGVQGSPRMLDVSLCGQIVRIRDDAGNHATCPRCQEILQQHEALAP